MNSKVVITISREYGSGGHSIGARIAKELKIPLYDKDHIAALAKKEPYLSEANCEWLRENGLRPSNLIGSAFSFGPALGDLNSQLFLKESNVIWKLAQASSCVIIGRCADFVLQNMEHTYRIYLSSGMARRLRQINSNPQMYDADIRKEAKDIMVMDKKRAAYYNYYTGQIWGKASNYDMCIDTGKMGAKTADIILEYIRRSEQGVV